MDGDSALPQGKRGDWWAIGLLLLLAGLIHTWLISHTEVAARDCIGFIRYAWMLQHDPWPEVMGQAQVHPGYPVAIFVARPAVALVYHGGEASLMEMTAQVVSGLMALLAVVPMYYLGRDLFSPR